MDLTLQECKMKKKTKTTRTSLLTRFISSFGPPDDDHFDDQLELYYRSANFVRKTSLGSLNQTKMKKAVMKLELHDDRDKKKAMKTVSGMSGVDSIQMDMKDRKLTVVGDIDPIEIVGKLRKLCHTEIVSVGPAKEPEKKKEEPKKEEAKKPEDKKKEEAKKAEEIAQLQKLYQAYYNSQPNYMIAQHQPHYLHRSAVEEDPNACVIC